MIRLASIILLATAVSAHAADTPTRPPVPEAKKPTCGKTVEECQKVVDDMTQKLGIAGLQIQGLQIQRDNFAKASANSDLNAYVQQQQSMISSMPVAPEKK